MKMWHPSILHLFKCAIANCNRIIAHYKSMKLGYKSFLSSWFIGNNRKILSKRLLILKKEWVNCVKSILFTQCNGFVSDFWMFTEKSWHQQHRKWPKIYLYWRLEINLTKVWTMPVFEQRIKLECKQVVQYVFYAVFRTIKDTTFV